MLVNLQQLLDLHNIRENKLTKQKRIRAQKKTWSDSQHKFEVKSPTQEEFEHKRKLSRNHKFKKASH